jgi:hypothetical protein
MRPVGSALFGNYADRRGRKGAMIIAVIGVGLATAAFGVLPTLAQIGVAAPVVFLILRLTQGVFVGGVVASTHTIGTESVPPQSAKRFFRRTLPPYRYRRSMPPLRCPPTRRDHVPWPAPSRCSPFHARRAAPLGRGGDLHRGLL